MEDIEESNPDLETNLEGSDVGNYDWDNIDNDGDLGNAFVEPVKEKEIGPDEFVMLEKEPAPVNMDDIKKLIGYPPMAKEAEIEGKVVLRVQVDKTGSYLKHIVIKDPHPILTAEVVKHIRNLKFTPGIQSGKPIKVWVTIPFDFKLLR
jgi:protein TonB